MPDLETIRQTDKELTHRYQGRLIVNYDLDRSLVSFQANKAESGYRWFKYKEGFSARLVEYLLRSLEIESGQLLDPFAGSGAALFGASMRGMDSVGIELLPIGCEIIRARKAALFGDRQRLVSGLTRWSEKKPWRRAKAKVEFPHLRITAGAFPPETEVGLRKYLTALAAEQHDAVRQLLQFAALCILETISYTRKDGQYLRWDYRSGRRQGKKRFDKGPIPPFDTAIEAKLAEMVQDLRGDPGALFREAEPNGAVEVLAGSCLDHLPRLPPGSFDCLITSPPYCNRYDYTRTYALELAFLGKSEDEVKALRQAMVSCTVENREKEGLEGRFDAGLFDRARQALQRQRLLGQVLEYLEARKDAGLLNNNGIPRMVRNYFRELALVIFECARVLKPRAPFVMVNDNVRYEGAGVPVDLILSDIAQDAGFEVEKVWVLPVGKGNSSQQMGRHGRDEVRKCVYVWRAPTCSRANGRGPVPAAGR